jgi:hypothetical protein
MYAYGCLGRVGLESDLDELVEDLATEKSHGGGHATGYTVFSDTGYVGLLPLVVVLKQVLFFFFCKNVFEYFFILTFFI